MNTFLNQLNRKPTKKGGEQHVTTMNHNLDLFSSNNKQEVDTTLLVKALTEDNTVFAANLLYLLDIRGGKGERQAFELGLKLLIEANKELGQKVIQHIGELGRWDYTTYAFGTNLENFTLDIISKQIQKDLDSTDDVSLIGKWLPSINAGKASRVKAKIIAKHLGKTFAEYRTITTTLRKKLSIVEHNITTGDLESIDFSKVPSRAMIKYNKHFETTTKFQEYKEALASGDAKINTGGIYPATILHDWTSNGTNPKIVNARWAAIDSITIPEGVIPFPVIDTSPSMGSYSHESQPYPIHQSLGLGLYLSENLPGSWANTFLTFDTKPTFVKLPKGTITDRIKAIHMGDWGGRTDINAAFAKLLGAFVKGEEKDFPTHLVIISDMEFDGNTGSTNYEDWTKTFADKGLKLPHIVFWNAKMYGNTGFPVTEHVQNTTIISGENPKIAQNVFETTATTPYSFMEEVLGGYIERFINVKTK